MVTVAVVGIGGFHTVTVMDVTDTVQGIIAVEHFQSIIIKDAVSSVQNVILIPGADSLGISALHCYPNSRCQFHFHQNHVL